MERGGEVQNIIGLLIGLIVIIILVYIIANLW
jgi:tetrahydromethanopterin S-methyltransferase subunit F